MYQFAPIPNVPSLTLYRAVHHMLTGPDPTLQSIRIGRRQMLYLASFRTAANLVWPPELAACHSALIHASTGPTLLALLLFEELRMRPPSGTAIAKYLGAAAPATRQHLRRLADAKPTLGGSPLLCVEPAGSRAWRLSARLTGFLASLRKLVDDHEPTERDHAHQNADGTAETHTDPTCTREPMIRLPRPMVILAQEIHTWLTSATQSYPHPIPPPSLLPLPRAIH